MGWTMFGLSKEGWEGFHTITSVLFMVTIGLHIYMNWKILWYYFLDKVRKGLRLRREMALSLALSIVFAIGSIYQMQPFWKLMDWNASIKKYWERVATVPPVTSVEGLTLKELADALKMPVDSLIILLQENEIQGLSPDAIVKDIAEQNNTTPKEIYSFFQTEQTGIEQGRGIGGGGRGGISGYGRMTVEEVCKTAGIPLEKGLENLKKQNITASADDTVLRIAAAHNLRPREVADIIEGKK